MLSFFRSHLYMLMMAFSASLSLFRGLVVAYILVPSAFSEYAAIIASGSFLAYLLSFGLIETTIKQFPRLFIAQKYSEIINTTNKLAALLFIRTTVVLLLILCSILLFEEKLLIAISFSLCIAYANSIVNLASSLQRSLFNMTHFALGSMLRASLSFFIVIIGAMNFGFIGAITAEIIAIILGAWGSKKIALHTLAVTHTTDLPEAKIEKVAAERGKIVFFAFLALSAPFYLDKIFINTFFSKDESSAYAFTSILMTGAAVLVNIIAQKVGPEIIRMQSNNASSKTQILYAAKWSLVPIIIWCVIILLVLILVNSGFSPDIFEKYHVTNKLILSVGVLGVFQVSSIFEFLFFANDDEPKFLILSTLYFSSIFIIASLCVIYEIPVYLLVLYAGITRLAYLISIILTYLRNQKNER